MENGKIKNKIIALSGEPVSGKGTAVKMLIEKLEEQGYKIEQIHLESTWHDFIKYFNSIIDLVLNLNNKEKLDEITQREELKNKIGYIVWHNNKDIYCAKGEISEKNINSFASYGNRWCGKSTVGVIRSNW